MPTAQRTEAPARILLAVVAPFQAFFRLEAAAGLVLMGNALLALAWASSPLGGVYARIFHAPITVDVAGLRVAATFVRVINDGLMTLFFAVAGLEIKRELATGELASWKNAALPLIAALGGMVVPALLYTAVNGHGPGRAGWAVPTATDIAFSLGALSLVRRRVPASLFVFLTALAIFDDLGAIAVIATFYGQSVQTAWLAAAAVIAVAMGWLGRSGVTALWPYAGLGASLWIAALRSGVHATIAGVVIGLALPTVPRRPAREALDDLDLALASLRRESDRRGVAPEGSVAAIERHLGAIQAPLDRAMHRLHGPVAFGIVPLFALANAGVALGSNARLGSPVALGAFLGLFLGKPIGVLGASWLAVRLGLATPPAGATRVQLAGAAMMAGIGFTMSLFVGNLGLGHDVALEEQAKLGVLAASFASAIVAILVLRFGSDPLTARAPEETPLVLDVPRFGGDYRVEPFDVTAALRGRTLAELDVRRRFSVLVVGMWRGAGGEGGARRLEPVDPERPLEEGVLLVTGRSDDLAAFASFASGSERV